MKILSISNYFPSHPGGVEFVAMNLVMRWRKDHQVRWAACDVSSHPYSGGPDDLLLAANNFTENWLGFPYPLPALRFIPVIFQQVKWCDVVHFHDCLYFTNIVAFLASQIHSKPVIVTQHVGLVPYKEMPKRLIQLFAYQTIGKLILERVNEIIFINENVKEWFQSRLKTKKISFIPNGVNRQIFYPPDSGEKELIRARLGYSENDVILLFIGRFTQKKGIHLIKEVALKRPQYHWVMVGRGDVDISQWSLPNIKIFPPQSQIRLRDFYLAADIFVLPSTGEGFPLAVQESLSCGLPTAVSEEVALSQPNAPLIKLHVYSSDQVVQTLDETIANPKDRKELQFKSQKFALQWDWDITAHKYEELFISTVKKSSPFDK